MSEHTKVTLEQVKAMLKQLEHKQGTARVKATRSHLPGEKLSREVSLGLSLELSFCWF